MLSVLSLVINLARRLSITDARPEQLSRNDLELNLLSKRGDLFRPGFFAHAQMMHGACVVGTSRHMVAICIQ